MYTLGPEWSEPESAHLERKASFEAYDRVGEAICAFANDLDGSGQGGVLLKGRAHVRVGATTRIADQADVQRPVERRIPELPLAAVRQLVRNAVMHRSYFGTNAPVRIANYPDRLEMISPGGPYGIVKRHNFGEPYATDYRNPTLASALRELGFVQKFGAGLSIARQAMSKLALPPPEFQVDDSFVRATLWKGRTAP